MSGSPLHDLPAAARSPHLPVSVAILCGIARIYLFLFKRFRVVHADQIPAAGPLILVANHTTAFDPVCLQVACPRRLIRFMQAREYYEKWPLHYLYKMLRVIPVNRTGHDTTSVRTALRTLSDHGCLGIFPEGKISEDGRMHKAHQGVALLVLMSNATVVPSYLHSTRIFRGMLRDFFVLSKVTLYFGPPLRFDDLAGRHPQREALAQATNRIMDAIVAIRDRYLPPPAETSCPPE